jgi:hypothetical protein
LLNPAYGIGIRMEVTDPDRIRLKNRVKIRIELENQFRIHMEIKNLNQPQCHVGVVLVMGAWNYPLQLSLAPVAGLHTADGLNSFIDDIAF